MKDYESIRRLKAEANSPKSRLIEIMSRLEEQGAIRESKSLGTIIGQLEAWQNR